MTIRDASPADVAWLVEQLAAFAAAYGTRRSLMPTDPALATAIVTQLVASQPFFVAVDDTRNVPVGFIAGALVRHPYNPELRVLQELFWWVEPAHRGTTIGARLLAAFEAFGRAHADWVTMTLEAHSPVSDRVLLKRGFQPHERSFLLEV